MDDLRTVQEEIGRLEARGRQLNAGLVDAQETLAQTLARARDALGQGLTTAEALRLSQELKEAMADKESFRMEILAVARRREHLANVERRMVARERRRVAGLQGGAGSLLGAALAACRRYITDTRTLKGATAGLLRLFGGREH